MMLKINTNFKKGIGWSLATLTTFSLFSYLTFIPNQTFAESLIVDPNEHRSLSQIDTMQEMSQQICINSRENETKQLRDTRDDKTYWVTKLKDSNCWMTQNLDYDIPTLTPISNPAAWQTGNIITNTTQAYYDPGDYIYNGPNYTHAQATDCTTEIGLDDCQEFSQNINNIIDLHYHVGNYYSKAAALNKDAVTGQDTNSICPSGWTIPTSGKEENGDIVTSNESFGGLLKQYSWASNSTLSSDINNKNGIWNAPLYFVYGGQLNNGKLNQAGSSGWYLSSTQVNASAGSNSYGLTFANTVFPANTPASYLGLSVRCLATGGWLDSYPEYSDTGNTNISVTVSPVISIDATSSMTSEVDFTTIANGSITADISSNMAYQVLLSTAQTTLERNPQVENNNIPMITIDQDITAGTSSWGIKKKLSATTGQPGDITNASVYSPIGITNTETGEDNKVLFFRSATAEKRTLDFSVGIAVDPKLPSGTYSTEVTITAVAM